MGSMTLLGSGRPPAIGGGAASIWNSADKDSQITLSGSNLIATMIAEGTGLVRATNSKSSGNLFFRVQVLTLPGTSGGSMDIGIVTSGRAVTVGPLGASAVSAATQLTNSGNSALYTGNFVGGVDGGGTYAANDFMDIAVRIGDATIFVRRNNAGNWNGDVSANPATNTNGLSITAAQTWFPTMGTAYGGVGVNPSCKLIAVDDSSGAIPSSFSWWG